MRITPTTRLWQLPNSTRFTVQNSQHEWTFDASSTPELLRWLEALCRIFRRILDAQQCLKRPPSTGLPMMLGVNGSGIGDASGDGSGYAGRTSMTEESSEGEEEEEEEEEEEGERVVSTGSQQQLQQEKQEECVLGLGSGSVDDDMLSLGWTAGGHGSVPASMMHAKEYQVSM